MSAVTVESPRTSWGRVVGIGVGLAAAITVILLAFSWPAVTSTIGGLPVVVVGSAEQTGVVTQALETAQPGVFEFEDADDRAAAIERIEKREAYGAVILGQRPEVITSSAASTIVSAALGQVAVAFQAQSTAAAAAAGVSGADVPTVTVTDIVPLSADDPRGVGLASAAFPMTMGGMIGGIAISLLVVGSGRRLVAVIGYAAVAGFTLAGVLQGAYGALQGSYLVNAGALGLTILAISAPIVGAVSLIGRAGIAVGPIVFLLFANPISAATAPVESLPGSWGAIGQLFPPGAGATLLRDLSYFPDATNLGLAWLVVSVWAAVGLILIPLGRRSLSPAQAPAPIAA